MKFQLRFWLPLCLLTISTIAFANSAAVAAALRATSQQQPETGFRQTSADPVAPAATLSKDPGWPAWLALPHAIQTKVDPRILAELSGEGTPTAAHDIPGLPMPPPQPLQKTRFLVYLRDQTDLSAQQTAVYASQADRRHAMLESLISTTQAAQTGVKGLLGAQITQNDVTMYQAFYIVNALAVEGSLSTLVALAQRDDVVRIVANYPLLAFTDEQTTANQSPTQGQAASLDPANWNISMVGADRVWTELGIRGQGAVVAGFDTGVDLSHPALVKHYRGNLGNGQFNHNYNWFEPDSNLYANGNLGASMTSQPHDCAGHGTHTMGTAVGAGDGPGEQIGMAPDATWIALPGICFGTMPGGINDDIGALKAFQWLFCPTDLTGDLATADCSKAPDVVNNSWGSANPLSEVLRPAIQKLRAAGIAPVFAAGNPSAGPGSIGTPANAPEAITVGATDRNDQVAYFSGRGPSFYPGVQKPQLTAPGVGVLSSIPGGTYIEESGTSMAAPHVTGLIALMVAADLQDGVRDFDVDELEHFMNYTAIDLGKVGPDDDYGYGRINAYEAVRWVLSAGDLRGKVVDANTKLAVDKALVRGINSQPTNNFSANTNGTGLYSITVPAGDYNVQVQAWGYYSATFIQQTVLAHALSQADFALKPLPKVTLSGFVRSSNAPIDHALIYAEQSPDVSTYSNADGSYALELPVGTLTIGVRAPGQRIQQTLLTVGPSPLSHDFALQSAPTILLIDADAQGGWFSGWSTLNVFQTALDDEQYQYDIWRIQYSNFTGTKTLSDGSIGYGIPPLATLQPYQLVIWAHHGCAFGCYSGGTPRVIGADETLTSYLDQGGRLILSGQDIGSDNGTPLFDRYLHARQELVNAATTDDTLTGAGFLQGINLTITNASLYGYANGYINLSPDGVAPAANDGAAYPVLTYTGNQSSAALAIDSCTAPYRAVYFAVGFENIGPRAGNRSPALAETLGRSIEWATGNKPTYNLSLSAKPTTLLGAAGGRISYQLHVGNTGALTATMQLAFAGNQWPTQLTDPDGNTLTQPLTLGPCATRDFTLSVDVPAAAHASDKDNVNVNATFMDNFAPAQSLALTTVAFPSWQSELSLPTVRFGFGTTAMPNTPYFYTLGGAQVNNSGSGYQFLSTNERYDTCVRRWETLAPLPEAIGFPGSGVLNRKLYVVGGVHRPSEGQSVSTPSDQVYVYDPVSNQWAAAAKLPRAASSVPVAATNGQLYAFVDDDTPGPGHTYAYNPQQNRWQEKSAPPGTRNLHLAAAALDGKIYVARDGLGQVYLDVYDPATDSWSSATPLNASLRAVPGLTAGPDGFLYATGLQAKRGGASLAERYDPQNNRWEMISNLNNQYHFGAAAVYATGRIFTVGGLAGASVEALPISHSFCLSDKTTQQTTVTAGGQITYTVKLNADTINLDNVTMIDPLPVQATFVGFGANNVAAVYNAAQRQIEWRGALPANRDPVYFSYGLTIAEENVPAGEQIGNQTSFDNGNTLHFTRAVTSTLIALDLSASSKAVDRAQALSGEVLTYTIDVRGRSMAGGPVSLRDPLPVGVAYVPDSLRFSDGAGHYDDATRSIVWDGELRAGSNAYLNASDDYVWGDSDGNGQLPQVGFAWVDISQTGKALSGGDDVYKCNLPIGFEFTFYGAAQSTFCLSSNGLISFNTLSDPGYSNVCPLPAPTAIGDQVIAALWDDLVVNQSMHYQTLGVTPNRTLVVQWEGVRSYATPSARPATFQLMLYENGAIRIQVLRADGSKGGASTTGVENFRATRGLTYACNQSDSLHDNLAVLWMPPGGSTGEVQSNLHFQAMSEGSLGVNTWLTNTATIATLQGDLLRSAATLINSVDLSTSGVRVSKSEVNVGETFEYAITLRNTGLLAANQASFALPLPSAITYAPDSLFCDAGQCAIEAQSVQWAGALHPGATVNVRLSAQLTTILPDRTPVTTTLQLSDGFGQLYTIPSTFLARRSDLSASSLQIIPPYADPGATVSVALFVRNLGSLETTAEAQINVPAGLIYQADSLVCGTGECTLDAGIVTWHGSVAPRGLVPIRFQAMAPASAHYGDLFTGTALVKDTGYGGEYPLTATLLLARTTYLPLVLGPERKYWLYFPMVAR